MKRRIAIVYKTTRMLNPLNKYVLVLCLSLFAVLLYFKTSSEYTIVLPLRFPAVYKVSSSAARQEGWGPPRPPRKQACVHPNLPLYSPDINKYIQKTPPIQCTDDINWVYTRNGKIYLSKEAVTRHGSLDCVYNPISFGEDDDTPMKGNSLELKSNGTDLPTDAFEISCKGEDGMNYHNIHFGIKPRKVSPSVQPQIEGIDISVIMLGLDSLSRAMWQRVLPKTHQFFTETMGGIVLEGYNIVGDGTPQQLIPILTGVEEREMPETRVGKPGAKFVDEVFPFVWKKFENIGYTTLWAEDQTRIASFNMRLTGFRNQPTHHYSRPFFLSAEKIYSEFKDLCLGSRPRHMFLPDQLSEFLEMYEGRRLFGFAFYSEISHEDNNKMQATDDDYLKFLQKLNDKGYLNNTILILMSDHGARFSEMRATEQGKLEERMPYFGFRFPPWFYEKYPREMDNFKTNVHRLTTPFDIHATFEDLIRHKEPGMGDVTDRGMSLFQEIPPERTCSDAGVDPHWCACMQWEHISAQSPEVTSAVNHMVSLINSLTEEYRSLCHALNLHNIKAGSKYITSDDVLRFRHSDDNDGRVPDLRDRMKGSGEILYHVTFTTTPGMGLFEATLKKRSDSETFVADPKDISRLNMYGNTPHCVVKMAPHLRPYCVCLVEASVI